MKRRISLEGLTNFRDLGGYETNSGKSVKWRRIFRSDTLAGLTDNDISALEDLGIMTACDLRYGDERTNEPSRLRGHPHIKVMELGFDQRPGEAFLDSLQTFEGAADAARNYLIDNYRKYPFIYAKAYRRIFDRLLAEDRIIIHCTAGKDRAGMASAMVLSALGVPKHVVLSDYLLTNKYWDRGGRERPGMDAEAVAMIFAAREEYFEAGFAELIVQYDSIDAYLKQEVGLTEEERTRLKELYLE
tara:strand:- start:264 stop:998 length:735 start_codon:yes stop_codon:yes gene_type:complete